jgi:NAD(P)-dependent dehydrogenase (short-subunit alcohol dehydrogenase family)
VIENILDLPIGARPDPDEFVRAANGIGREIAITAARNGAKAVTAGNITGGNGPGE